MTTAMDTADATSTKESSMKTWGVFSFLIGLLLATTIASAQTPIRLNILERLNLNATDRFTTINAAKEGCDPDCPSEGQFFYVPESSSTFATALYRQNNGADHLDSTNFRLNGYVNEGTLGFPSLFANLPGLAPIFEAFNASTGDHALTNQTEQLSGYVKRPLGVYGYPRYPGLTQSMLSLSRGGVTIESNRVDGGSLEQWTWNGKTFLSSLPNYLQGSFALLFINNYADFLAENSDTCGNHAPLVSAFNRGATQSTLAVPLANSFNYGNNNWCLHPVAWQDVLLGKSITLNFAGLGPVAKYVTTVNLPTAIAGVVMYHPLTWVDGQFNRYFTYDAETATLQEITLGDLCEDAQGFSFNFGGIVEADQSLQFAIGAYGVSVAQGGSVDQFSLLRHVCSDGTASRMDVIRVLDMPAGYSTYNVYFMTGTLAHVTGYMDQLFQMGAK
jgi:hypothetical protein